MWCSCRILAVHNHIAKCISSRLGTDLLGVLAVVSRRNSCKIQPSRCYAKDKRCPTPVCNSPAARHTDDLAGCYNCSQRRIDCDRTEPACKKCISKGLVCCGNGIRYRFNVGLSARGKWTRKTFPVPAVPVGVGSHLKETPSTRWEVTYAAGNKATHRSLSTVNFPVSGRAPGELPNRQNPRPSDDGAFPHSEENECENIPPVPVEDPISSRTISLPFSSSKSEMPQSSFLLPYRSLQDLSPFVRLLLDNFSENIAPAMVVFDGEANQFRSIILPLATQCQTIRYAVLASSAHQLSSQNSLYTKAAAKFQSAAIQALMQSSQESHSQSLNSLAAIMILLFNEMISGGSSFHLLHNLMLSCIEIAQRYAGSDGSILSEFLREHTQMIDFYVQPLLNETEGAKNITLLLLKPLTLFTNSAIQYPEQGQTAKLLECAIRQAGDIYCHRALNNVPREATIAIVQRLKALVEDIPSGSSGEQTLVWVYFIAAAESSLPCHREFFLARLLKLHERLRFSNIPKSINMLKYIWENHQKRWTEIISETPRVLIM